MWTSQEEHFWPGCSEFLKVTSECLPVWRQPEDTSALDFKNQEQNEESLGDISPFWGSSHYRYVA
jgi:hypothetical protein